MTSKSSKFLPYFAMLILVGSLAFEAIYEIEIDLESAMPLLLAVGVSGAGLKAVERAAKAKTALPNNIQNLIKNEIRKLKRF